MLALQDQPTPKSSTGTEGNASQPSSALGMRFMCGVGALPVPAFAPKRAAVRVHAISGAAREGGSAAFGMQQNGERKMFEYQIVFENVGAVPVEILGRCAPISMHYLRLLVCSSAQCS